jgi:hypothetical protein
MNMKLCDPLLIHHSAFIIHHYGNSTVLFFVP